MLTVYYKHDRQLRLCSGEIEGCDGMTSQPAPLTEIDAMSAESDMPVTSGLWQIEQAYRSYGKASLVESVFNITLSNARLMSTVMQRDVRFRLKRVAQWFMMEQPTYKLCPLFPNIPWPFQKARKDFYEFWTRPTLAQRLERVEKEVGVKKAI